MCDVIRREKPDYVFHLGDHDSDAEDLRREFTMLPISGVRGNCDWHSDAPLTLTVLLGGHRFFLCHGHTYGVKSDPIRARGSRARTSCSTATRTGPCSTRTADCTF